MSESPRIGFGAGGFATAPLSAAAPAGAASLSFRECLRHAAAPMPPGAPTPAPAWTAHSLLDPVADQMLHLGTLSEPPARLASLPPAQVAAAGVDALPAPAPADAVEATPAPVPVDATVEAPGPTAPAAAPEVALVAPPPLPTAGATDPTASAAAVPFATLRRGQSDGGPTGPIRDLQQVLRRWNPRLDLDVNGRYDERTARAVLLYKAVYGTGHDGRSMDPATAANLAGMQDGSFWRDPPQKSVAGQVLYDASQELGTPYRLGGDGRHATDCALFTRRALTRAGVTDGSFSRLADEQYASARQGTHGLRAVDGAPRPGDLVFFNNPTWQSRSAYLGVTHVGFYLGNGCILAASSGRGKVVIERMDSLARHVVGYARAVRSE